MDQTSCIYLLLCMDKGEIQISQKSGTSGKVYVL